MTMIPAALLVGAALAWSRFRLTPIVLSMWGIGLVLAGTMQLDDRSRTAYWLPVASGALALLIGYAAVTGGVVDREAGKPIANVRSPSVAVLAVFASIVLAFVVFHFLAGGIPILSSNVEIGRFEFGRSGLFGLPGRMYLFGLPFLVILASAFAARYPGSAVTWIVRISWGAFACAQLLTGFKSALLTVLVLFVLVRANSGKPLTLRELFAPRLIALAVAALAVAYTVAFQYASLQLSNPGEAIAYLEQRLTVIGAQPGYVAMSEFAEPHRTPFVIDDLQYLVQKYTGQRFAADAPYPLELIVSARLAGQSLGGSDFISPSTVGAFASWYVDITWIGAATALLVTGGAYGVSYVRAVRTTDPMSAGFWGFAIYLIYIYISNGGIVYWAINGITMAVLLGATWLAARGLVAIFGSRSARMHGDHANATWRSGLERSHRSGTTPT